ncbi:MAG: arginine--tRNA ligase [Lachnospiraceae bacterium]|jgi:arginine--tRNA ligase
MKKIIELLNDELKAAFSACGYDEKYAKVVVSNRPDLCQYQCNGCMAAAKEYKKAPAIIAGEVVEKLAESSTFSKVEAVNPGFINMNLSGQFIADYVKEMGSHEKFGCDETKKNKTIMLDYGGANVAKPLHVGHLRPAIIGESLKRICAYNGYDTVGDVHLGDWGLQMGLIIMELKNRKPELPYFDESFTGEYPAEAPFTLAELEDIYPCASRKSKEDAEFAEAAHQATVMLQRGHRGYTAIWKHIMNISIADLKRNYDNLNVSFDVWKGESDAKPYIEDMLKSFVDKGYAYESQGALVIDVAQADDKKEIPPCIVRKSDGAALYATTDLATMIEREKLYHPFKYIYTTDKRQEMHFTQIFRAAKKTGIVPRDTEMNFLGFGTMNGKDGKPFKTRNGDLLRLEYLIKDVEDAVYNKIKENRDVADDEARATAKVVGLAAIKYGDLSNQASKDYIFDIDRFTSFEGDTGPYVLYTIVRIKSILNKYEQTYGAQSLSVADRMKDFVAPEGASETDLCLLLTKFSEVIESAYAELAPHKICKFIYDVANVFNSFYHDTKILTEEDEKKRNSYIALITLTKSILETCTDLLAIKVPDRM